MNTIRTKHSWEPYLWLLPSVIMLAVFVVYPIILVFRLSFSEISKSGVLGGFVGFLNYVNAVNLPAFKTVMLNTLFWVVSVVGLSTLLGFIIAMVLNQKFHGRKIARAILVFPWATSLVVQVRATRSSFSGSAASASSSPFLLWHSVCSPACSPSTSRSTRRPR